MSAGKVLRVGMVGAGWVTQHHLLAWQKLPDTKVVAICDPNVDHARERAQEFGIEHVYSNAIDMLAAQTLDVVDIASPRETHVEMVRLAAAKNLAILCQKPLASTFDEAEKLVREMPVSVRLMIHENWRFRSYYRQIKQWLDAGLVGKPLQCFMTLLSSGMLPDASGKSPLPKRQPFIRSLERMLVMEMLIHHIDTLRFLLGPLEILHASLGRTSKELVGEDRASVYFRLNGGGTLMLLGNIAAAGYAPELADRFTIIGDAGTITLDAGTLKISGKQTQQISYDISETYQGSYDDTIRHFADCLISGQPFETAPEDNLKTLRIVEGIYQCSDKIA